MISLICLLLDTAGTPVQQCIYLLTLPSCTSRPSEGKEEDGRALMCSAEVEMQHEAWNNAHGKGEATINLIPPILSQTVKLPLGNEHLLLLMHFDSFGDRPQNVSFCDFLRSGFVGTLREVRSRDLAGTSRAIG